MSTISQLPTTQRRKTIKIYLDAFVRQPVPCPTCTNHCCQSCHSARGYVYSSYPNQPEAMAKARWEELKSKYGWTERNTGEGYSKNWKNEDQGFFVAGKGCRIPYKERSRICVSFTCKQMNREQNEAGWKIASALTK